MAIAEDTTNSPARVISSGATTDTAAFTPPNAGCIIVCFMFGDANTGALDETLTASDTLGGTWSTPILDNARGGAAVAISWRAVAAGTAASMVVKVTDSKGGVAKGNYTRIFTGTDLTTPFGATGVAGTSNISLVSTVTNSWCWSALLTSNVLQVAGANTTQKTEFGGFDGGDSIGVYASTNTTATAGTTITLAETGGTPVHNVAIELLPPGGGPATLNAVAAFAAGATMVAGATQAGFPAASFAAGASMAAAATQTGFPAAAFAAGATMAAAATRTVLPTVNFAAGASMAAGATQTGFAAATFAAGATMTAGATRTVLPTASFAAGAIMTAGATRAGFAAASFAAGAVIAASAGGAQAGAVTFAAGAAMVVAAGRTVLAAVAFAAGATMAAAATGAQSAGAAFAAGAVFSITADSGVATAVTLVAGGSAAGALVPGGAATATLIASGATTGTLSASGV